MGSVVAHITTEINIPAAGKTGKDMAMVSTRRPLKMGGITDPAGQLRLVVS
jgi:hypothetical protein